MQTNTGCVKRTHDGEVASISVAIFHLRNCFVASDCICYYAESCLANLILVSIDAL